MKKKKILKDLFFYLFVFATANSYAQLPENPATALSPNAASLGLYGDIPVSLYTGTPDISIPLYDVRVGNYSLPISLSYHASGVRVDQHPGWTGLGWSLFAGGVITRTVHDMPDEYDSNHLLNDFYTNEASGNRAGYYYNNQYRGVLYGDSWNYLTYLQSIAQSLEMFFDTAPDEFSFSFPGCSGKFYLDHQGNWVVQCNKPVKVEFDGEFLPITFCDKPIRWNSEQTSTGRTINREYSPCFRGFIITAEDGTKYVFGGDSDAIDFSLDFFNQNDDDWTATAWYLTKIILPANQAYNPGIEFTYERKEYNNQMYIAAQYDVGSTGTYAGWGWHPRLGCSNYNYSTDMSDNYGGKLIAPVYLKEITTDDVVVSFNKSVTNELRYKDTETYKNKYEALSAKGLTYPFLFLNKGNADYLSFPNCLERLKWYQLDAITVKNRATPPETLKTITFSYSNSSTQRLTLDSVCESGKNPYRFLYDRISRLPGYLSNKTDHWGFFNNTSAPLPSVVTYRKNNQSYVDTTHTYPSLRKYYQYREPKVSCMQYGVLNKIFYPTGGYTEFEFEPHDYRQQLQPERWQLPLVQYSANQLTGGLRIKRIKNSPTQESPAQTVKEYYYVSDYPQNKSSAFQSSGVLGGQIQYFLTYTVKAFNDNSASKTIKTFSSISLLPSCNNGSGSHIGYTEVIEEKPDNSFTRYQFSNFDNGYMDERAEAIIQETTTPYVSFTSKASDRGLMLLQEDYNADGKKVKRKDIVYTPDNYNYVRAMDASYKNICTENAVSYDEGAVYKILTYTMLPFSEIDSIFDSTNGVLETGNYYHYANKLTTEIETFSRSSGESHSVKYKYPMDYLGDTIYDAMIAKNILNPVVEKSFYKGTQFIEKEVYNHQQWHSLFYAPYNMQYQSKNGNLETRLQYDYDQKGNIREAVKDGEEKAVYLWGYHNQYPIAAIENATFAQVQAAMNYDDTQMAFVSSRSTPSVDDWNAINGLRQTLPHALVTTYTYKPLVGRLTATDPRGQTVSYTYDDYGRLTSIKDPNDQALSNYSYKYTVLPKLPMQIDVPVEESYTLFSGASTRSFTASVINHTGTLTYDW
ncbi:MAG: RHS repeat protein, partial [Candidatus Symbiothrix sp.]|nr:RHS repeat protein [Candidatus Symbiothrix sp.]